MNDKKMNLAPSAIITGDSEDKIDVRHGMQISGATPQELGHLKCRIHALGRQTMNLRIMPDCKALVLKNHHDEIFGWACLNLTFNQQYPEFFSLYVAPQARNLNLGILLEALRCEYAIRAGYKHVYLRIKRESDRSVTEARVKSGLYRVVPHQDLESTYLDYCQRCELFGNACTEQNYLRLDTQAFLAYSCTIIGALPDVGHQLLEMPLTSLTFDTIRDGAKKTSFVWKHA